MATYVNRLDLTDPFSTGHRKIRSLLAKVDRAFDRIGTGANQGGWDSLLIAVHDLAEMNQLSMATNCLKRARKIYSIHKPGDYIAKRIDEVSMFIGNQYVRLQEEHMRVWMPGPPYSIGDFMIIRGNVLSYESAENPYQLPIGDSSVDWYLRIGALPCRVDSVQTSPYETPGLPDPEEIVPLILDPLDQSAENQKS